MSEALFDGDQISHNSYIVPRGTSAPRIITYPRTIGGILQESGVVEKRLNVRSYIIPPGGGSREDIENYFHELNELIGSKEATLLVNGNHYPNCNVENIQYEDTIVKNFTRFDVNILLGEQNTDNDFRQLDVPELEGFSRGRIIEFETEMEDGTSRTFTFWHNFDLVKNFETTLTVKRGSDTTGWNTGIVLKVGGFERIVCYGWIIGPELHNRKNLEAYFYNIMNGPLGRLGTITIGGTQVINNALLTELTVEDSTALAIKYQLTFLVSLQC
jgi:hypothetical protein